MSSNNEIHQQLTRFRITLPRITNNDINKHYVYSIRTIPNITPTINNNETKSTISMVTIRMDKTTTISATIQQEQQQKQKKNLVPPILFHQPKTKQKSCSANFVLTNKNKRKILLHQSCFNTIHNTQTATIDTNTTRTAKAIIITTTTNSYWE